MVVLDTVRASNSRIRTALPASLVALFVGATNGVGETTVREFAKHAAAPRVYVLGRSQEAGDRITAECRELNPEGTFNFIQTDASLMRNVDAVCADIASKETAINLLFLSVGTLQRDIGTKEGLNLAAALTIYARNRYIEKLLPLVKRATSLRRIVSVYGATFEGQIDMEHFQGSGLPPWKNQGHMASITTLSLEGHRKTCPEVSYVHNFPGAVESGIARGSIGWFMRFLKTVFAILGPLVHIPLEEAGQRHLFLCTSARFSAGADDAAPGVPLIEGLEYARGTTGRPGSGVYSIDANGDSASSKVETLLAGLRETGAVEQIMNNLEHDIGKALAATIED